MGKQETMVERVARAITLSQAGHITGPSRHRASDEFGWKPDHSHMKEYVERHWRENIHAAQFAIEAMSTPTDAMIDAGVEARMRKYQEFEAQGIDTRTLLVANHPAGTIYEAMLTAALNEDSGE